MIREDQERTLLAGAQAFLAGETGVIETARALSMLDRVRPELRGAVNVLTGVDSETDDLPIGKVRALWNSAALVALEPRMIAAIERYRDTVRAACEQIVRVLDV